MTNKVALVTGASAGIGTATALRLLNDGFIVYGVARRTDRLAELAQKGVRVFAMDVTNDDQMQAGVQKILDEAGRIDVLVNNAGYGSYGSLEDVPISEARYQFDVNIFGLARLTQLVLPTMRAQRSGTIVNISSMGGKLYAPMGSWYHSTKFALEGLSDSLRLELRPFGIRVVIIEPGAIKTEWADIARDNLIKQSRDTAYAKQANAVAKTLGQELGSKPEVVARAISKAVRSRRPRPRYAIGLGAKPATYARRFTPDQIYDLYMRVMFSGIPG